MAARTGFLSRSLSILGGVIGQDPTPIRRASPEQRGAPPPTGAATMFTRAWDGFAVGEQWLSQLAVNDDSVLQREGVQDMKLFDALLDDEVAFAAFQQRQLALVSRPWVVEPGNPDDPRSVQAADDLRDMINAVGWDRVCRLMLYAIWYGHGVAEFIYSVRQKDGRSLIWLDDVVVPDRKWFAYTNAGELRMRTPGGVEGAAVPPNKFWSYRTGATHDFAMYGTGLAHWCYWPIWFKRNALQFWALYLEKFGQPTAVVPFTPGSEQKVIDAALAVGKAIGSDSAVAVPASSRDTASGYDLKPYLLEAQRTGGADSYRDFCEKMDTAVTRAILSQTMTSEASATGIGSNQADVHKGVRDEVVKSDSDGLHESFNRTVPVWLTRWNYGEDVAPPTVYRNLNDEEDLTEVANRDAVLDGMGWQRTEDSFRETYGDGYERKPEPDPRLMPGGNRLPLGANDNQPNADQIAVASFAAGETAPLYVSRKLKPASARALLAWARGAGFVNLEEAGELHVTVCYSRAAVDWFDMPEDYWSDQDGGLVIKVGGPRKAEKFGDDATVLMFGSRELKWRHRDLEEAGASHDWPGYYPHVTFAKGEQTVDLETLEPFTGELAFGPEIWERIRGEAGGDPLPEMLAFTAEQLDAVGRLADDMTERSEPIFRAVAEVIRDRIATFEAGGEPLTRDSMKLALLQCVEKLPGADLARIMGVPFAAERAGAAAGVEDSIEP